MVQRRKDIDKLYVYIETLLQEQTQGQIRDLFELKDRAWSVVLKHGLSSADTNPLPLAGRVLDEGQLQKALAVLSLVKNLEMGTSSTFRYRHYLVLKNLPTFQDLHCMDLHLWSMDPHDIADVLDFSFAPQIVGTRLGNQNPPPLRPLFTTAIAKRAFSLYIDMVGVSVGVLSCLLFEFEALPCLQRLQVVLPNQANEYAQPMKALFMWLETQQCKVTDLSFYLRLESQLSLVRASVPKVPRLRTLRLVAVNLKTYLALLLLTLAETPRLEHLVLVDCEMDKTSCSRLLEFQLSCRPRMLTMQLDEATKVEYAALDKIHRISLVYQTVRALERSRMSDSFPKAGGWPRILETMGYALRFPSVTVNMVGMEAIYNVLHILLTTVSEPIRSNLQQTDTMVIKKEKAT